ncbi:MAG: S8 family serine peptidase [Kineosporiaceae bacterium]
MARPRLRWAAPLVAPAVLLAMAPAAHAAGPSPQAKPGRYIVLARSDADYRALRAKALSEGAKVAQDIPKLRIMAVEGSASVRASLASDGRAAGVATDHVSRITTADPPRRNLSAPGLRSATRVSPQAEPAPSREQGINPDPAWDFKGLLWDYRRIGLPRGWRTTAGSSDVTVGVADTGLDYTHSELRSKVTKVVDLTTEEDPPLCKTYFGVSDQDLAAQLGGPVDTDWNGHDSWIGGNIAAALDGQGTNGIAPGVDLVALKISQWCGSAYDSTILDAFVTGADLGLDVISISFGGYLDRSDPDQDLIYRAYIAAVRYAKAQGTQIVAAAGNEHVQVGPGGRVLNHGSLTTPGDKLFDAYGLYEVPGGVPGVVDVSATGNVVVPSSASCPPGTTGSAADVNATCKPASDAHQAAGQGRRDQLAYYSNYGPRIDIAAPGGARKFNLPLWDRGGTPGFPVTSDDRTNVWETFSITSNWAVEIPCYTFTAVPGFPPGECYSTIQGTSMATPHVSAALALIASAHPALRHKPPLIVSRLLRLANDNVHNSTKVLSAGDTSPADLTGAACPTGYCHLGGARISDADAYGAGLVNVSTP